MPVKAEDAAMVVPAKVCRLDLLATAGPVPLAIVGGDTITL